MYRWNEEEFPELLMIRDQLALATKSEIRRLAAEVDSPIVQQMLKRMASQLFDSSLSIEVLKVRCGIRDNSASMVFHGAVGEPPGAFLARHRLEVAKRLLRDAKLPVWKVGALVGYGSLQSFSRAFHRVIGCRPSQFRNRPAELRNRSSAEPSRLDPAPDVEALFENALAGRLTSKQAAWLLHRLLSLYPPAPRAAEETTGRSPGGLCRP